MTGILALFNPGRDFDVPINVKAAMVICLIFASFNALKEIVQVRFVSRIQRICSISKMKRLDES